MGTGLSFRHTGTDDIFEWDGIIKADGIVSLGNISGVNIQVIGDLSGASLTLNNVTYTSIPSTSTLDTRYLQLSGANANQVINIGSNNISGLNTQFTSGVYSGRFGVGTIAPEARLEVFDNGTNAGSMLDIQTDDNSPYAMRIINRTYSTNKANAYSIYQETGGDTHIYNNAIDTMILKNGGVGLGGTTPGGVYILEVGQGAGTYSRVQIKTATSGKSAGLGMQQAGGDGTAGNYFYTFGVDGNSSDSNAWGLSNSTGNFRFNTYYGGASNIIWEAVAGTKNVKFYGSFTTTSSISGAAYHVGSLSGATGTFTTVDSKTITVTNGLVTAIV